MKTMTRALRQLFSHPMSTLAAILCLALAIGANTAVFSVVNGVLLQPLGFADPARLVVVWERVLEGNAPVLTSVPQGMLPLSPPDLADYRERNEVFEDIAGFGPWVATLSGDPVSIRVDGMGISPSLFSLLGVEPLYGRTFLPEEDWPGRDKVVILSHGLWQRRWGGDPAVVGIMPPGFDFPDESELWKPIGFDPAQWPRNFNLLRAVARLKDGVGLEAARSNMDAVAAGIAAEFPDTNKDRGAALIPFDEHLFGDVRPSLMLLQGAVLFVLLIACATLANLLLARAAARRSEIATRLALGAGRGRLMEQLLLEGLLLGVLGGAGGLLLARWGLSTILPLAEELPRGTTIAIDGTVLLFTFALSLVTAVLFAALPAWQATRPDLALLLKSGGGDGRSGFGGRFQAATVVAQVAVAVVLVIGAGLMIRSFQNLLAIDPGMRAPDEVLTAQIALVPATAYGEQPATAGFFKRFQERVSTLPGVDSVGSTWFLPFSDDVGVIGFSIDDQPDRSAEETLQASVQAVTPGYFETAGIPLRSGRSLGPGDDAGTPPVTVINETLARRFFPGEEAVGKRITYQVNFGPAGQLERASREIVGVVGDVRQSGFERDIQPEIYFPNYQATWRWASFVVRSAGTDPARLVGPLREQLKEVDADIALAEPETMGQLIGATVSRRNLTRWLLGVFAVIATVLALLGIYGVTSYAVSRRVREIGLRLALGARRGDVLRWALRRTLRLGLIGVALGLVGAYLLASSLGRFSASVLFELSATDTATYIGVALAVLAAVLLAAFLPARRASRVDPLVALRLE